MGSLSIGGISLSKGENSETLLASVSDLSQEEFEDSLRDLLEWLYIFRIGKIVFQAGGDLVLPDWFIQQCRQAGIQVEVRSISHTINKLNKELKMEIYSVNSNIKFCPVCWKYMLRQNRVIVWDEPPSTEHRDQLSVIGKGDLILLYHNDHRIVAVGFAVNECQSHEIGYIKDKECWVDVNWIWKCLVSDQGNYYEPVNHIERDALNFPVPRNTTVRKITDSVDLRALLEQIGQRQLAFPL